MFWVWVVIFLGVLMVVGASMNKSKSSSLVSAQSGATRVETVKQMWVNQTVAQYARAGWEVVNQSSAKSLGSQARVTITFKKA